MTRHSPPRWLEHALVCLLPPRDRETIAGDLLEEYREEQEPQHGALRANLWYLRQTISFLSIRRAGGPPVKAALTCVSVVTALTGLWLAVMENILKHPGYGARTAVAALIVAEALGTLVFLRLGNRSPFRLILLAGATALGTFGIWTIARNFTREHLEGFVLIVGCVLIAQAVMTLMVVLRNHQPKAI